MATLKDPCYIFIDLNNGSKYIRGFDDVENPSVRIGTRVAVASGLVPECPDLYSLLAKNDPKLFGLSDVICEILKRRFKMQQRSVETIIIHLDEYQRYINDVQQYQQLSWIDSCDFFKSMLKGIGSVMRGNNMKDEYDYKYFIIPIYTGTSAIDIRFLPTEHTQILLALNPLNYDSAKSMFLDKYEYSRQTTETGRNLVVQSLKLHYSSDLNNENIESLSTEFCNFVLNQQHFRTAIFDTGFIPKLIDDLLKHPVLRSDLDWGNQLFAKMSRRAVATVGDKPGNWKSFHDIRTIISFGLTGQPINRNFRLPSRTSIGELERAGLIYLSCLKGDLYTINMPFMLLKMLNNKLLVSKVEKVLPDNLLLIPTHGSPWHWQNFELLYGHNQKAFIDSLINVKESTVTSIHHEIQLLQSNLQHESDARTRLQINYQIEILEKDLDIEFNKNWRLSDVFRGAKCVDALLQRKVRLHKLGVFTENKKFLERTSDTACFDKSVSCDDDVTRSLEEGIFRCYRGCANIDHRWVLESANNEKNLAFFSQIKYSERDTATAISALEIKRWYEMTLKSVENFEIEYDIVLVIFTNRRCTGNVDMNQMPQLILIHPENIAKFLSPTFAHRGLVDAQNDYN
ncbi:12022_t:CDS:1 [Acaulospora colombiana]|uniref:12022_t:CDS:1 n=1 Tax=Acaulospora colombiana TaxID=27376 RepID=A0ACA9L7V9_9GLOM|nr:12022_t:CDS:1 [Acaulospora colombiana]